MASLSGSKVFEGNDKTLALASLQIEAQALLRRLAEAESNGLICVQILTDCIELVRAIKSHHQPYEISNLVHDLKINYSKFLYYEICKVSRQKVDSAHVLATIARQGNALT